MLAAIRAVAAHPGPISPMLSHRPVMLDAALAGMNVVPGGIYVDATFGRGGHRAAILSGLGGTGSLHAIDQDPAAARHAAEQFGRAPNFRFHACNFDRLLDLGREHDLSGRVNGILFDLGVSSPQLEDPVRGFSFAHDGPLDMRMDPAAGESAAAWLARATQEEIADVLWRYGEERASRRIAKAIVTARDEAPIERTAQLAAIILRVHRGPWQRIHPATRSFQAIRIHINRELERLEAALRQAVALLAPGGRLVVISFHSLEDRIVKRYLRDASRGDDAQLQRIGRAQRASSEESATNPRSRSAVLRIAERRP